MSRCFLLILFAVACAIPILGQGGGAAGTWDVTLNSPQGTFNIQFNLKQDGEKLSGVVKGQRGERPLEGTLKGKDVTLKWTTKISGKRSPHHADWRAGWKHNERHCDYGGFAQGDFSAKRAATLLPRRRAHPHLLLRLPPTRSTSLARGHFKLKLPPVQALPLSLSNRKAKN
jgi:hypothetical protein